MQREMIMLCFRPAGRRMPIQAPGGAWRDGSAAGRATNSKQDARSGGACRDGKTGAC